MSVTWCKCHGKIGRPFLQHEKYKQASAQIDQTIFKGCTERPEKPKNIIQQPVPGCDALLLCRCRQKR